MAKIAGWAASGGVGTVERAEVMGFGRRLGRVGVVKGASGNFAVLRNRDFRLLFSGQLVSVFGDRMVLVALAFAVLGIGGSASDVGFVLAGDVVALVAGVLIGGVVADRASRRRVMVASDLVRLASQATVATLLITGTARIWMLAVLAGVAGVVPDSLTVDRPAARDGARRRAAARKRTALQRDVGGPIPDPWPRGSLSPGSGRAGRSLLTRRRSRPAPRV